MSVPRGVPWSSVAEALVGDPAVPAATAVLLAVVTKPWPVAVVWRAVPLLCGLPVVGAEAGGQGEAGLGGRRGELWLEGELYLGLEPGRGRWRWRAGRSVDGRWQGVVELALLWGRRRGALGGPLAGRGRRRAFCWRRVRRRVVHRSTVHFLASTYLTALLISHHPPMSLFLKRLVSGKKARYRDDQLDLELGRATSSL